MHQSIHETRWQQNVLATKKTQLGTTNTLSAGSFICVP